jgi:hypothetical protein
MTKPKSPSGLVLCATALFATPLLRACSLIIACLSHLCRILLRSPLLERRTSFSSHQLVAAGPADNAVFSFVLGTAVS